MASAPSANRPIEAGEEAGLVLSSQQGEIAGYRELVLHHRLSIYRAALELTYDRAKAAWLMQQTLVLGWQQIEDLPVGRPFVPWLVSLMRKLHAGGRGPADAGAGATRADLEIKTRPAVSTTPSTPTRDDPGDAFRRTLVEQAIQCLRPRVAAKRSLFASRTPASFAALLVGLLYAACVWWGIGASGRIWQKPASPPSAERAVEPRPQPDTRVAADSGPTVVTTPVPEPAAPPVDSTAVELAPIPERKPPPHRKVTTVAPAAKKAVVGLLCGTVHRADGRPIAAAAVKLAELGIEIRTDRAGRFCVTIPAGDRSLEVSSDGFAPVHVWVVVGRQTTELSFTLQPAPAPAPTDSQPR